MMHYFINSALNKQNSGIEHAQLSRAQVFREQGWPFLLLYTNYNPQLSRWLKRFGVAEQEALTLFDYYQRSQVVPAKRLEPDDIWLSDDDDEREVRLLPGERKLEVYPGNPIAGRISWYEAPDDEPERCQVSSVERFDYHGMLYRVDHYDWRGWLSASDFYTRQNEWYQRTWWAYDTGEAVITEVLNRAQAQTTTRVTRWQVKDRNGHWHAYHTFRDLVAGWFDELNHASWSAVEPNYWVGDRMEGYEDVLEALQDPAIRISHIHNSHGADVHDELHSLLNNYYEYDLFHRSGDRAYDFYIAATHKQTQDMRDRFGWTDRVVTIPVGLNQPVAHVPMNQRQAHSVLVTARRAEEKRIEQIVRMVGMVKQRGVEDITLDVYGYRDSRNDDAAAKKINQALKEYDLDETTVRLHDYNPDLETVRDRHQVYMVWSTMEGFNIALMEAQNHGEVAIVNDVNYGPNELTVDGENGFVCGYNDIEAGAERLYQLFTHPDQLQAMSERAYQLSARYFTQALAHGWKELHACAHNLYMTRVAGLVEAKGPMTGLPTVTPEELDQARESQAAERQQRQADQDEALAKEIAAENARWFNRTKGGEA